MNGRGVILVFFAMLTGPQARAVEPGAFISAAVPGDPAVPELEAGPLSRPAVRRQPCSAMAPSAPRVGSRTELEAVVAAACAAAGGCGAATVYSESSGKTLAELGLWPEPVRSRFSAALRRALEDRGVPSRVPLAMAGRQTLAQLADGLEAGLRLAPR